MAVIGYARISTKGQNLESQRQELAAAGCELIVEETGSGAKGDREGLKLLLDSIQQGDTICVYKLDRLGRSLRDLLRISEQLQSRGVHLKSTSQDINTNTAMGRCFFSIIGAIAELEREQILERTAIGLDVARKSGRLIGRRKKYGKDTAELAKKLDGEGMPRVEIARKLRLGRTTLYQLLTA